MPSLFKKTNKVHPQNNKKELQPIQRYVDAEEIKELWKTEDGKYLFVHYDKLSKLYKEFKSDYHFNGDGNMIDKSQKIEKYINGFLLKVSKEYPIANNKYPIKLGTISSQVKIDDKKPLKPQIDQLFKVNKDKKDANKQKLISIREYYRDGGNIVSEKGFQNPHTEIVVDTFSNQTMISDSNKNSRDVIIRAHGIGYPQNVLKNNIKENDNAKQYFSSNNNLIEYSTWDILNNILCDYKKSIENKKTQIKDKQLNVTFQSCYQDLKLQTIEDEINQYKEELKEFNNQYKEEDDENEKKDLLKDINATEQRISRCKDLLLKNQQERKALLEECAKVPNLQMTINYCNNQAIIAYTILNMPLDTADHSYKQMKISTVYDVKKSKWVAECDFANKNITDTINCHGEKSEPFALTKEKSFVQKVKKIFNNNRVGPA